MAEVPSTERVSLGRQYEKFADYYYRSLGYRLVQKNIRLSLGEVDLLFARKGEWLAVEVRGRRGASKRPSQWLGRRKVERLKRLSIQLRRKNYSPLRMEFCEIIGKLPPKWFFPFAVFFPKHFGIELARFKIDGFS